MEIPKKTLFLLEYQLRKVRDDRHGRTQNYGTHKCNVTN